MSTIPNLKENLDLNVMYQKAKSNAQNQQTNGNNCINTENETKITSAIQKIGKM